jgi:hypothetical protein
MPKQLAIYIKGAIEPLYVKEPMMATINNMNAAMRNNTAFFVATDPDDDNIVISIPNVLFMREEEVL